MQGKGVDTDWKFLRQLSVFGICFLLVISTLLFACEGPPKHKQPVLVAQYQEGDIVYLKPDSTIGVIGDVSIYTSDIGYKIGYKNNQGEIQYQTFTETQIYSKK